MTKTRLFSRAGTLSMTAGAATMLRQRGRAAMMLLVMMLTATTAWAGNIADCELRGIIEGFEDGYGPYNSLTANVQVWYGDTQLEYNTDYDIDVEYVESYEVGQTYNATITGMGDWSGTKDFTFTFVEPHHNVVFIANGGTGTMADDIVGNSNGYAGRYYLPECTFTAPFGKVFDHWEASCEEGVEKQPGDYFTAPYIWQPSDIQTITVTAYWAGLVQEGSTSETVTIPDGENLTLVNATITGGIVCEGSATITLVGTNSVSVVQYNKAGIQIGGSSTTLTIKGDGSLTATGGSAAAGIGLGRTWDASVTAGAIVIEGGTINAGGDIGIGIGTVGNSQTASIDGISIKGGTVNASLGKGYLYNGSTATIGYIKIYDTIDMVDASKITETVTYMHGDDDVTANKTDYLTISENGDRRIIVPKDNTDYTITIADGIEHGTLTAAATAKYMETVTVTATPDFGYRFVRLVVKDADDNDVASTNNTFQMPKSSVTVSTVFEQGVHGTTEFAWGYSGPSSYVTDATIYDGVTTVNIQNTEVSYNILKYEEYTYSEFRLDNNIYDANIPYAGGTGEFYEAGNGTSFMIPDNGETGYYDITLTDVGGGKWGVSILPTAAQMDAVPVQTYTGSAITPEPTVIACSLSLTKGTDYVYSYTNNTNVGTATVRATFQGTYASLGYVERTFIIVPANINLTANVAPDGNYWTTFYCGDAGYTIDDGENAWAYTATYSMSGEDGTITLHKLGKVIPAGTAVIVVGEDNEVSMTLDNVSSAEYVVENNLHGVDVRTLKSTLGTGTFYAMGKVDSDFGFFEYTAEYMPASKAYLLVSGGVALAKVLTMVFEDEETSIHNSQFIIHNEADAWYSLDGRRLSGKPTKNGLYINNGRKVVVK